MNNNETRTLWISLITAFAAVFLLYSYTQEKSAELTKDFGTKRNVVVASEDISEMQTIYETELQIVEKPEKFVEPNALVNLEDAVGLVALAPIKKGEQILTTKIIRPGAVTGLSHQVAPSKRAVAIPVDEMRGVAKLLKPGDRIDLITALDVGVGQKMRKEVKTFLQDIPVLATGIRITNELPRLFEESGDVVNVRNMRGDTSFNTITVEVSPEQAQELVYILATAPGGLFISLRHPTDRSRSRKANATINTVLDRVPTNMVKKQMKSKVPSVLPKAKPAKKPKRSGPFKDL
jgi:pilus assembly protein CpaB